MKSINELLKLKQGKYKDSDEKSAAQQKKIEEIWDGIKTTILSWVIFLLIASFFGFIGYYMYKFFQAGPSIEQLVNENGCYLHELVELPNGKIEKHWLCN